MAVLLEHYSLSEIFMFTVFLALAIKSLIGFFDWAYTYLKQFFNKETEETNDKENIKKRIQHNSWVMTTLQANQDITDQYLKELSTKIDMLIDSDKDAIKSYITSKHHYFCYQVGWIDDFSLDCLEKRYLHYAKEGGNSFIEGFMNDLRNLPKKPPTNSGDH